jgi:hypothetical protein
MDDKSRGSQFSAAPSAIGYLFQCRCALFESLKRLRKGIEFSVSLETLDDVVFETEGQVTEILQTKHHFKKAGDLTDSSTDLWRTLRIWSEGFTSGEIPPGTLFYLLTTSVAPERSAAFYLKIDEKERDVLKAIERLNSTAESSSNQANAHGYSAYRLLTPEQKVSLIGSVYIVDSAPSITDLDGVLREEIYWAVEKRFQDEFIQRLEGWWLHRAIHHLSKRVVKAILSEEVEAQMTQLREQFKQDNLPIDEDILAATVDASGYHNRTFVHQLGLIEIGNRRIFHAIKNYFRAFEQRSRWVREDLLLVGELERYEERLIEEWEILFERMREELGVQAAEEEKRKSAQALYKWVETDASFPIRPRCNEPFITRGSYQILADQQRVGWHPEFLARLRQLLEM